LHLTNSLIQIDKYRRTKLKCIAILILTATVLTGCGHHQPDNPAGPLPKNAYEIDGRTYHPIDSANGFHQKGVASWYGKQFHEKKTANGETYNMYAMTAAHKTLPFGTMVEVKNIENNITTIVRINDRGPFCRGRIIDLSHSAAKQIDMIQNGTAAVEITALGTDDEVLKTPDKTTPDSLYFTGDFTIQVGAFGNPDNAEVLKSSLEKISDNIHIAPIEKNSQTFYRVRVGRFISLKQAQEMEQHLIKNGFENVYTVAWDL